jgi:hypothetical protein
MAKTTSMSDSVRPGIAYRVAGVADDVAHLDKEGHL